MDGAGVRSCLETYDAINKKGLGLVAGTLYRHHTGYLESIKRVHDGQIGDIVGAWGWYNTDRTLEARAEARVERPRVPDAQLAVLHVAVRRSPRRAGRPQRRRAQLDHARQPGAGGRRRAAARRARRPSSATSTTTSPSTTSIPNGVHVHMFCRQQDGCDKKVANEVIGTKGRAFILPQWYITGENPWKLETPLERRLRRRSTPNLITSIRAGKPLNELKQVAESTLVCHPRPRGGLHGQRDDVGAGARHAEPVAREARMGADAGATGADAGPGDQRVDRCGAGLQPRPGRHGPGQAPAPRWRVRPASVRIPVFVTPPPAG